MENNITLHLRWWQILKHGWYSKLSLVANVFIQRVLIGGFAFGISSKVTWTRSRQLLLLHYSSGKQHSLFYTMSKCLSHLELHFSNLASFVAVLFDTKIFSGCLHNSHMSTQNQRHGSFSYSCNIGDFVIIGICAMLLYLMVDMALKHIHEG